MKSKIWMKPQPTAPEQIENIATQAKVSPIVAKILYDRGMETTEAVRTYFSSDPQYHAPHLLKNIEYASKRIIKAVQAQENILVYGDYDVDGICSTSLVYRFLTQYLRAENVKYFIPGRLTEGYGLNTDKLLEFAAKGTTLLISVDCGISNYEAVQAAQGKMDVIVTDHHQVPEILPPAYTVVNPQQSDCNYPFKKLAGVGVAFKLCQQLWQLHTNDPTVLFEDFLELVAIATVADIVPLVDENRCIVKRGLVKIADSKIVGIRELIKVSGCEDREITASTIGFSIAPRINAVGRMGNANIAVELLTTEDINRAREIAEFLQNENIHRQNVELGILTEVEEQLIQNPPDQTIILANAEWNVGVVGIVSSKLVDKYYLPTILFSIDSNGIAKGSGRSIKSLDLYQALSSMKDLFLSFGGHHQAAGMSLYADQLPEFTRLFNEYVRKHLTQEDFVPHLSIDCEVDSLAQLDEKLLDELNKFEPCGFGNSKPRLVVSNTIMERSSTFSEGQHLRMQLQQKGYRKQATMWKGGSFYSQIPRGSTVNVAFNLNLDNRQMISMNVLDVQPELKFHDLRYGREDAPNIDLLEIQGVCGIYGDSEEHADFIPWQANQGFDSEDLERIVFSQPPTLQDFTAIKSFIKAHPRVKEIYFLFTKKQRETQLQELCKNTLSREDMVNTFLNIKNNIDASGVLSMQSLQEKSSHSQTLLEQSLKVLLELELIKIEQDNISLVPIANKRELTDSVLFKNLQAEYQQEKKFLEDLSRKSMAELFE